MKATLQYNFDLDNFEDRERLEELAGGNHEKLKIAVDEFSQRVLRKFRKYGGLLQAAGVDSGCSDHQEIENGVIEYLSHEFYRCLEESGANID